MTQNINPLITSLYTGSIKKAEFLKRYFNGKIYTDKSVLDLIEKGITNKDKIIIEETIVLIYTGAFAYSSFTLKLCYLLQESWHEKHEDIAMLLKEIADISSVECLYKAAELQLDYLDYDDTYQFARKCIKALSAIGNEDAIEKLQILSNSKTKKIAEYAIKELRYKEML